MLCWWQVWVCGSSPIGATWKCGLQHGWTLAGVLSGARGEEEEEEVVATRREDSEAAARAVGWCSGRQAGADMSWGRRGGTLQPVACCVPASACAGELHTGPGDSQGGGRGEWRRPGLLLLAAQLWGACHWAGPRSVCPRQQAAGKVVDWLAPSLPACLLPCDECVCVCMCVCGCVLCRAMA